MRIRLLAALLALSTPGLAAEPAYLDDRSSAEALVRSLYNAVNRKEFARAYSYFTTPPADTLDAYAEGYASTASVEVLTGAVGEEGAAGSIFYQVPVAIRAESAGGGTSVFAGCYVVRLANPQIQADPFVPMSIESGKLGVAQEPLEDAVPERCGDGPPPPPRDAVLDEAKALFRATYAGTCQSLEADAEPDAAEPDDYTLKFRYSYEDPDALETETRLFRFWCRNGAYNEVHVYLFADAIGELRVLNFATPELDIRYENDDAEGKVEDIYVIGYRSAPELINSDYDEATQSIHAFAKWRGIGDASSVGKWIFRGGEFSLVRYEVDASYDEEINPQVVVDYDSGP